MSQPQVCITVRLKKAKPKEIDILYFIRYNNNMMRILETDDFKIWIRNLKDQIARAIINARIRRLSFGNKGDSKAVGDKVFELRIDYGPGYRVYYFQAKLEIIMLLCGGDKSSQSKDIENAKAIVKLLEVSDENG
jgi:putative addiction module killer protein